MPQETLDIYVAKILSKYQYPDRAKRDVNAAVFRYKSLRPKLDTYVFNDGTRQELACLEGTIPVMYKGVYYHIPICVWILDSHPYNSPMCYVKPTADMQIKASRHVDTNGRVYLPYLHNWNPMHYPGIEIFVFLNQGGPTCSTVEIKIVWPAKLLKYSDDLNTV